jgi:hypothetical protein
VLLIPSQKQQMVETLFFLPSQPQVAVKAAVLQMLFRSAAVATAVLEVAGRTTSSMAAGSGTARQPFQHKETTVAMRALPTTAVVVAVQRRLVRTELEAVTVLSAETEVLAIRQALAAPAFFTQVVVAVGPEPPPALPVLAE